MPSPCLSVYDITYVLSIGDKWCPLHVLLYTLYSGITLSYYPVFQYSQYSVLIEYCRLYSFISFLYVVAQVLFDLRAKFTGAIWFSRQNYLFFPVHCFGAKNTWLLLTLSDYSLFQYLHLWFILTIFSTLEYVFI